jgi:hypothetical protein
MDIYLNPKLPIIIATKEILDKLCLILFECQYQELGDIMKIKNKKIGVIKIFLSKEFSIDRIKFNSELSLLFKEIRCIAAFAKEENITVLPIIRN